MHKFIPYLIGGLVVLCVDYVPAATSQLGSVSAAIWAGQAPGTITTGMNVDRSRKGDRLVSPQIAKAKPADKSSSEQAQDKTPAGGRAPMGCEPSFSPVVSPALAHITGRCAV